MNQTYCLPSSLINLIRCFNVILRKNKIYSLQNCWQIIFVKVRHLFLWKNGLNDVKDRIKNNIKISESFLIVVSILSWSYAHVHYTNKMLTKIFDHIIHLCVKCIWTLHMTILLANFLHHLKDNYVYFEVLIVL